VFPCQQWLSTSKGDGQISRELVPYDPSTRKSVAEAMLEDRGQLGKILYNVGFLRCSWILTYLFCLQIVHKESKGKVHTPDIAPLSKGTLLQKCSGMAPFAEGFQSFTCTPTHLSTNGRNHTCLCISSQSFPEVLIYQPRRIKGWVGLGTTTESK